MCTFSSEHARGAFDMGLRVLPQHSRTCGRSPIVANTEGTMARAKNY
jgi:hypothetical protein